MVHFERSETMTISVDRIDLKLGSTGMTRSKFAEKCGMSRQALGVILKRGSCLPVTAGKLAAGLGCQLEDIIERK